MVSEVEGNNNSKEKILENVSSNTSQGDAPNKNGPLKVISFPPEVIEDIDSLLLQLQQFAVGLPKNAILLRHVELILRAFDFDPSPLDLHMLAVSTGSSSDEYVQCSIYDCIDYFLKRKNNNNELLHAYYQFDKHDKGYISLHDLRRAAVVAGENMSDIELKELIDEATEGTGENICKEDFIKLMQEVNLNLKEN